LEVRAGKKPKDGITYIGIGEKVDELKSVATTLQKIDGMFFEKGAMIRFLDLFTDFAGTQPNGKALVKLIGKNATAFIDYMEKALS
jgi:hypothetical protein